MSHSVLSGFNTNNVGRNSKDRSSGRANIHLAKGLSIETVDSEMADQIAHENGLKCHHGHKFRQAETLVDEDHSDGCSCHICSPVEQIESLEFQELLAQAENGKVIDPETLRELLPDEATAIIEAMKNFKLRFPAVCTA